MLLATNYAAAEPPIESNVTYGMYSGLALLMDVHHPGAPNGYGVLFVSGSGWNTPLEYGAQGLKDGQLSYVKRLADAGYTVFTINHRAAPRFQFPAQLVEVMTSCAHGLAQRRFRAQSKQAVENNGLGANAQIRFGRNGVLRSRQAIGHLGPKFDKCNVHIDVPLCCRIRNFDWRTTQAFQLLAHEFAAIAFFEGEPDFDLPSAPSQAFRGDQSIAGVMTLSRINDASAGIWEKFSDCPCNARACLIHQRFDFDTARESPFFRFSHLRRS
jgi:hypothetical protein